MSQELLSYLKITCQDSINKAYRDHQIEEEVYRFGIAWLSLIINLLEPIIHQNTKESRQFLNEFLYGYEKDFLQMQTSFFTQIKLGTGKLKANHDNKPIKFFTEKHEKQACHIFLAGLLSAVGFSALCFYSSTLLPLPIISMLIISSSILLIFCIAAIHQLQKSKSLENTLAELVYFENQPQFMNCDKIRLFTHLESSCKLDLTRFNI